MAMSIQQAAKSCGIPSALAPPVGTGIGLRRPIDRFALRPSFASSPVTLPGVRVASAPRFSMRVASKQTYICRDCGQALPIAIIVGIALLGGVYFYVNNNF